MIDNEIRERLFDSIDRLDIDLVHKTVKIKYPFIDDPMVTKIAYLVERLINDPHVGARMENGELKLWYKK